MDIAITRMSSRGQIVIPAEMREGIEEGEKLVLLKNDDQIILKKVDVFKERLKEDLIFAKRTEAALKRYDEGKFKEMDFDDFLEAAKKW